MQCCLKRFGGGGGGGEGEENVTSNYVILNILREALFLFPLQGYESVSL